MIVTGNSDTDLVSHSAPGSLFFHEVFKPGTVHLDLDFPSHLLCQVDGESTGIMEKECGTGRERFRSCFFHLSHFFIEAGHAGFQGPEELLFLLENQFGNEVLALL